MKISKHFFIVLAFIGFISFSVKAAFAPTALTKYHIIQSLASSNKAVGNTSGQPSVRFVSTSTSQKFVFEAVVGETDTYYIKNDSNQYISNSTSTNLTFVATTNGNYSKWVIVGSAATTLNFKNVQTNAYLTSANTNNGTALTASVASPDANAAFKIIVSSTLFSNGLIDPGFENATFTSGAANEGAPLGEWINDRGVTIGGSGNSRVTNNSYQASGTYNFFIRFLADGASYGRIGNKINDLIPGATYSFTFKYKQATSIAVSAKACIYAATTALADSTAAIDGSFVNTIPPASTATSQSVSTATFSFVAPATSCYIVFKKFGAAYNTAGFAGFNFYIDDMTLTKTADPSSNTTLNADFESGSFYSSIPSNKTVGGYNESLTIVNNPSATGLNTTSKCVAAVRTSTGTSSFSAQFNVAPVTITGTKYLHVLVWKPLQSKMSVTFMNDFSTVNSKYYVSAESQWVDAVFEVPSNNTLYVSRIAVNLDLLAAAGRYSQNTNTYFDEVLLNTDPLPRGISSVASKNPSLAEDFEGSNTIVNPLYFGSLYYWKNGGINNDTPTDAIVSNPAKNNVNQTNNALKMMYRSTFSWDSWLQVELNQGAGMTVGAGNKYLHIMMYKNADAQFAVTTRVGSSESGWLRTTTPNNTSPDYAKANGWQDLVIEIPAANQGLINRLSINGHTTAPGATDLPVYIDEIEFSGTATPRTIFNVAKTYDFGAAPINNTVNYSLPITAGALLNGDLTVSISGNADFTTTTTTLTQVAISAGTATINLSYKPTSLGSKTSTLSIASNGVTLAQVGLAGTGGNPNEAINVDFESGSFYTTTPANIMTGGVGGALTIVDNPSKTGLNTTNKVGMGVRSASGNGTFQAEFNIEPTVINTTRYLHVLVLKPTHSVMSLNGRNNYPVSGNSWDNVYSATHLNYTTVVNEWVDVVFKIVGNGSKIDRLVIGLDNCNPATRYASNTNIYFDQVLLNDDPLPRGIVALPTKKTTFPEDFEGTSYVGDATYFPSTYNWNSGINTNTAFETVVANPVKNEVNASDKVLKTTLAAGADWWARIQFVLNDGLGTTVGAGNKYLHVMMYKAGSGGEVKLFLTKTDGVTKADWINPTVVYAYQGWQDLVFEVPATVFGDIKMVDILPHGGTATNIDVYMDNIEFNGNLAPRSAYYRTAATGNWSSIASWEASTDNSNWSSAISAPTLLANSITIRNGHELTVTTNSTASSLVIESGAKLTLNNAVALSAYSLDIQSNATNGTGTFVDKNAAGAFTVSGTTSVKQSLTVGRNWYISSPLTAATSNVFNAVSSTTNKLYFYNEPTGTSAPWTQITDNSTTLTAVKGYVANVEASLLAATNGITFTGGTLNTGSQPITITRTAGQTKEGFNLIGNPYISFLNVDALQNNADLMPSYWYRSYNSGYVFDTYNIPSAIGVSSSNPNSGLKVSANVPPMQAFWVRVKPTSVSASIAFTNAMRVHQDDASNKFRAPKASSSIPKIVRLQVSNGINSDETVLYAHPNASNGFDDYDSPKMSNSNASIPEIYTVVGSEQLVINGLNEIPLNFEIPLGFKTGQANTFSIKVAEMSNFDATAHLFLKDKILNAEHELTVDKPYSFGTDITSTDNRFSLIFRTNSNSTSLIDIKECDINVYATASRRIVLNMSSDLYNGNADVSVSNLTGQVLYKTSMTTANLTLPYLFSQAGVYLVSISNDGKSITKKVVIQ